MNFIKILFVFGACTSLSPIFAQNETSTLTANGSAILYKPADFLTMSVGVITEAESAEVALQNNNIKMKAIIEALQKKQLSDKEFFTGQFTFSPVYTSYPKDPPPEWIQKIIRYKVNNTLTIRTSKLELAGEIIDAVNQAGANVIDQIEFSLKNAQSFRKEAIIAATKKAIEQAEILAHAAGIRLVKIHQISLDRGSEIHPKFAMAYSSREMNTSIEPGDVPVHANVNVVFNVE